MDHELNLPIDNRDGPGPTRGCAFDFDWKARHHESGRWQKFEIVQLFDMAIADVTAGYVAFPDNAGISGFGIFFRGVNKLRVPASAVDTG